MGWFTDDRLNAERKKLRDDFDERVDDARNEIRREFKADLTLKDDHISDLEAQLQRFKNFKQNQDRQRDRTDELDQQESDLNQREELIELKEGHFEKVKEAHEVDMGHHHEEAQKLQKEAAEDRRQAANELSAAKTVSRKAGYDEGYAAGLEKGYSNSSLFNQRQRENAKDIVALAFASSAVRPSGLNGVSESDASKQLADAFAKHLTGTIERVMDTADEDEDDD